MANISDYAEKAMLDWVLGGATPTRPTVWGLGLSTAVPTASAFAEIAAGSGYAPQTMPMSAAASPAGSSTNATAATFGPFSGACTISGLFLKDTLSPAGSGNMLWYGSLATARTIGVGDSLVFAAGSLTITLT